MGKKNSLPAIVFLILYFSFFEVTFADNGEKLKLSIFNRFKNASIPTKTFSAPTGKVLNSLEVMVNMGS